MEGVLILVDAVGHRQMREYACHFELWHLVQAVNQFLKLLFGESEAVHSGVEFYVDGVVAGVFGEMVEQYGEFADVENRWLEVFFENLAVVAADGVENYHRR